MSRQWAVVIGAWILAVSVRAGVAQDAPPDPALRSTLSGVYVAAQADAGQAIFESTCLGGCHNMASHRGMAFQKHWDGKTAWDLFEVIHETMPKDDPGSLSESDSAQLIAYLFKLNGLQAGKDELPIGAPALKKIKIEFPPASAKASAAPARE